MGVLPFGNQATIKKRDGTQVATCNISEFRSTSSGSAVGQSVSYIGFASEEAAVAQDVQNLILTVSGMDFRIIDATHHRFARYVELTLRRVLPNG